MEMYWTTLNLSRNIIKYHYNLSKIFYSSSCISKLYSNNHNPSFKVSCKNQNKMQDLLMNNNSLTVNSRLISTSLVLKKTKDKGEKKKLGKAQHIDLNETREELDVDEFISQMTNAVDQLKNNYVKHLGLRSSTGSIEQIVVNFEGEKYSLEDLVQVIRKPKMVVLQVTVFPQAIPQILKAIAESGLKLNPQQDGTSLFIPIPKVTKEYREDLAKSAKALYIKSRDNMKDIKNKELKTLKKKTSISDDKIRRIQSQLEALCEQYVKQAESIMDNKQKELLRLSD